MKDETDVLTVTDPNPSEQAEYSLTVSCFDWQTIDGDQIAFEMVDLYDRQAKFSLICKVLKEIEMQCSSVIYVGTREKCEKWSEIFLKQGLMTEVESLL